MSKRFGAAALVFVLTLMTARSGFCGEPPPGDWIEATSDHFVAVGNASEKRLREVLLHLERIRAHFLDVSPGLRRSRERPLLVYVARDERTLRLLLPTRAADRKAAMPSGRFADLPTMQFVELLGTANRDLLEKIVAHEYFHYLARRSGVRLPPWLDEGLAEFWASTSFTDRAREVGRADDARIRALRARPLFSMERLFGTHRSSPEYRGRDLAPTFYAESWALVHYLTLDRAGSHDAELARYGRLVGDGANPVDAGREAFGDLERLESRLLRHFESPALRYGEMPPLPEPDAARIRFRAMSGAEAAARLALALLHTEAGESARELVDAAKAAAPALAVADLAAALYAARNGDYAEAQERFDRVAAPSGAEPIALYGAAMTRLARDRSAEGVARAERLLRGALAIDPDFTAAAARLADSLERRGGGAAEGLSLVRKAQTLRPDDTALQILEARLLAAAGKGDESAALLARLTRGALASANPGYQNALCWNGALRGYAREMLAVCDAALAGAAENFDRASLLDSRGVARAAAGDLAGAAADLEAALAALAPGDWTARQVELRRGWIAALRAGAQPLTAEALLDLRDSPADSGGWGR